jgi:hypothetical protein
VLIVSCKLLSQEFFVLPTPTFTRNYGDIAAMESDVDPQDRCLPAYATVEIDLSSHRAMPDSEPIEY